MALDGDADDAAPDAAGGADLGVNRCDVGAAVAVRARVFLVFIDFFFCFVLVLSFLDCSCPYENARHLSSL